MSNIYEIFETDVKKEKEGAWTKIQGDIEFKLCYFANEKFLDYVNTETEKWLSANGKTVLPEDVSEDIHTKGIAHHVLVDWKNVTDKDGKSIEHSAETVYNMLSDPNMRRLKAIVIQLSTAMDTFRVKHEDADSKNSLKSSSGN